MMCGTSGSSTRSSPLYEAKPTRSGIKYRLAFVVKGICVLRYDNEAGKGDHKHIGGKECPYTFTDPDQLWADFLEDVTRWHHDNRHTGGTLA